jgi:hypothetical protein
MRRSRLAIIMTAAIVIATAVTFSLIGTNVPAVPAAQPQHAAHGADHQHVLRMDRPGVVAPDARVGVKLDRFELVGHSSLDGFADYGDLYAHGDFAYVGSRCGSERRGGDGVQVVDISRPQRPRLVSKLANAPFTRAEDLVVLDVRTPAFRGTLAVVGIQTCFGSGHEAEVIPGLLLFDVTRPRQPALLGRWDLPRGTAGCHELDAVQRADGAVLVACARNLVDHFNSNGADAIHLVDVSDPASPRTASDWSLNLRPDGGIGCLPVQFAHSARFADAGRTLYVSYWDAGTVRLDVATPTAPAVVSTTRIIPPDEDGDNHSMTLAGGGRWLLIHTEDFSPGDCPGTAATGGWGEVYLYDNSDPAQPAFLGTFSTPNGRSTRDDGSFTDHNTEVALNDQLFSSWYSDGVVWWTTNDQGVTRQLGQFVPPVGADGTPPLVWGVFVDSAHDLILASDINSGLWIVKPKGLRNF